MKKKIKSEQKDLFKIFFEKKSLDFLVFQIYQFSKVWLKLGFD